MEIAAEEDEGDFHEFQMLHHHHSRIRRNAQQCGPLSCGGELNGFKLTRSVDLYVTKIRFRTKMSTVSIFFLRKLRRQIPCEWKSLILHEREVRSADHEEARGGEF